MQIIQALASILLLAELALLWRVRLRLPAFSAFLILAAVPYSLGQIIGWQALQGWRVWVYLGLAIVASLESAWLNQIRESRQALLLVSGIAMVGLMVTPNSALSALEGTGPLLVAYRVLLVANSLGAALAILPAVVAWMRGRPVLSRGGVRG